MIYVVFGLALLSACLYRIGGCSKEAGKKMFLFLPDWFFNTKSRDIGCPAIAICCLLLYKAWAPWWIYLLSFLLHFGSMTTYNKWASRLVGYKDNNVHWPSWLATGMMYSIATLPVIYVTGLWLPFVVRTIALGIFTMVWSILWDWDVVEEMGRGALIPLTIPILFI